MEFSLLLLPIKPYAAPPHHSNRRQRQRTQSDTRNWKQQWAETSSNTNNIYYKRYKKRNSSERKQKTPITDNTRCLPLPCVLNQTEPCLSGRLSLSLAPSKDMRWYRITSWPCPLPATAKLTLSWTEPRHTSLAKEHLVSMYLIEMALERWTFFFLILITEEISK